ncbi:hypothetical protein I4F81_011115 [Pyropia yezoensis]|uniref:Uncharacterized protein n=1 Tax=Pyropia yezoensis TaxID=2788 RepID=A0ACC3CEW3_PYRYE|nr:hypothetical protein I4F81_011115 [Neopyropia yezoensis]
MALTLAYVGAAYRGFQANAGVPTVEAAVAEALTRSGLVAAANGGDLKKVGWSKAARTDAGVSAVGNVVGIKLELPREVTVDAGALVVSRLNAALPPDITILGAVRVPGGFSARSCCGGRAYEYLLPVGAVLRGGPPGGREAWPAAVARLNGSLAALTGTLWAHNLTNGVGLPPPPAARRYVTRFEVEPESFLLYMIRKMVAAALLRHAGATPPAVYAAITDPAVRVSVPPAPAAGLLLAGCSYDAYQRRSAAMYAGETKV